MSTESFPSDLKDIKTEDFVKIEGTQMSISNISMDDIVMLSDNFQSLKLGQQKSSKWKVNFSSLVNGNLGHQCLGSDLLSA